MQITSKSVYGIYLCGTVKRIYLIRSGHANMPKRIPPFLGKNMIHASSNNRIVLVISLSLVLYALVVTCEVRVIKPVEKGRCSILRWSSFVFCYLKGKNIRCKDRIEQSFMLRSHLVNVQSARFRVGVRCNELSARNSKQPGQHVRVKTLHFIILIFKLTIAMAHKY